MNSKHLWSVIIASEDSYDSHDQWSHMIAMNTDCEQSLFIGTAMNLDSERSMIKHIIHDEVGSMLWNAGVHTWSTLILYHIMTPTLVRASKGISEGKWYSVVLSKFSENHECVMGFLQWLDISSSQVCVFQSSQQEPSRKKVFVGTLSDGGRVAGWLNRKEGVSLSRI